MTGLVRFCAVAIAAAGFAALTSGTLRAEECKIFGSVGSGLSKSVATLMAKQGAINISEARGLKASQVDFLRGRRDLWDRVLG
jgi:hypothetical protein